ncbi:MAG: glycosyltransferase family 4 protein [Candidatus Kerfeldbacteria bacterium]|nr:glycosyltransferase family 4 protein [Candidatus Kerfeldbacteria bacterium]
MRIGIDARFYGPHAGTGIGRYTNRLIEQLEEQDHHNEYVVFLGQGNFAYYHPAAPRFRKVLAPWKWYSFGEQSKFPALIRQQRLDFVHFLHFNVPLLSPRPFVVTVHDLILSKFPTTRASTLEPAFYWLKHAAYNLVIRAALQRSARVIAVTNNTKRDIQTNWRVAAQKIAVIYEACDVTQQLPLVSPAELERRLGIVEPFVMYVGTAYPHKNLERLVAALAALRQRGFKYQLVLSGRDDYFYRRLKRFVTARQLNRTGREIVFTGYVSDEVLDALYRRASLYVCPSIYEGFGLPGLEAMARGTPVLASLTSSLPEVYGQAAAYFDPYSIDDMVTVLGDLLNDEQRRRELGRRGTDRVKLFSWSKMAKETLEVYNSVGRKF